MAKFKHKPYATTTPYIPMTIFRGDILQQHLTIPSKIDHYNLQERLFSNDISLIFSINYNL